MIFGLLSFSNLREAITTIARKEGFRGFFRGLSPSILLTAPQTGLNFAVYKLTVHLIDLWETRILGRLPPDPTNASKSYFECTWISVLHIKSYFFSQLSFCVRWEISR